MDIFGAGRAMGVKRSTWRLLDTGCRTAAENMALDEVLLSCRSRGLSPDTLRLLRFRPPAVLVGYHQDVEQEVRLSFVRERGIDVNRRITGGGAIYFDETSVGWEIIASKDSLPPYRDVESLFELMCRGIVKALRILGVEASFRPRNDVEVGGRKISGTGGTEREDAILFQGTLLVDFDVETMVRALRVPVVKLSDKEIRSLRERVTCLRWELGYVASYGEIREAIRRGFEEELEIELEEGDLTTEEEERLRRRLSYFQSESWIYLHRRVRDHGVLTAMTKRPGGLIKVALALDPDHHVIKSILITGDFFIYPRRAIFDLEARLKFTPADEDVVRELVLKFFDEKKVEMPGVAPEDIVSLIVEALNKARYAEPLGLSMEEADNLYPVTEKADSVLDGLCDYVLLPYCSKDPGCPYRVREGCVKCGGCCVGAAYELAEKAGLKPVTITAFEHLMETLREMRRGVLGALLGVVVRPSTGSIGESWRKLGFRAS